MLLKEISGQWGIELPRLRNVMIHQIDGTSQIITGEGIRAVRTGGDFLPFLSETGTLERFPSVTVDMGAVRFVCKGANLMRPGITEFGEFGEGQIVCIVEETHRKFLAVGRSAVPSSRLGGMERGEVVTNLHYISDRFWQANKEI